MRRTASAALAMASCLSMGACSHAGHIHGSSAAPPLVYCGATLSDAPAGAVMVIVKAPQQKVTEATTGGDIYLRVSSDCDHGATVILPRGAGAIVKEALTKDRRPAAVVIQPSQDDFTVTVTGNDGTTRVVAVTLTGPR
jgi:hypothetical protein